MINPGTMDATNNHAKIKEEENMKNNPTIKDLMDEIKHYQTVIQEVKEALASAEQELDETLDDEIGAEIR